MIGVKLAVFDLAGTAIDFGSCGPVGAFIEVFARRRVALTEAQVRAPMGTHKRDHIRHLLRADAVGIAWRAATGDAWSEADVDELYRAVEPLQVEAAAAHCELAPGLLECVEALRSRGVKIAAATGYFRAAAEAALGGARRNGFAPDFAVCADDVPAGRPAPWMVYRAMEALDVYPPAAVVKVGDTLVDIREGLNAGVRSGAVVDSSSEMGLSRAAFAALTPAECAARRGVVRATFATAGAAFVVDSLSELPGVT